MTAALQNISLAAFICAIRSIRRNGVIYAGEPVYKLAGAIGISPTTCARYIERCKDLGLLIVGERRHSTLVPFTVSLSVLFPQYQNNKAFRHVRFFAGQVKTTDFKTFKQRITFALAQANFERQKHYIAENKIVSESHRATKL